MLNEHGHELPDPRPMARPLHISVPETLAQQIQRMVRSELSQRAAQEGHETFEDADDFDVGEDAELSSPYELTDANFEDHNGSDDQRFAERTPSGKQATDGNATTPPAGPPAAGKGSPSTEASGGAGTHGTGQGLSPG